VFPKTSNLQVNQTLVFLRFPNRGEGGQNRIGEAVSEVESGRNRGKAAPSGLPHSLKNINYLNLN